MPQKRSSQEPPPVMTWSKALPVLVIGGMFDILRAACALLWLFGPALAALYCTDTASGLVGSLGGLTATACTTVSAAAGVAGASVLAPLGTILALAVGLFGWLVVLLILLMRNPRIFKENAMAFGLSLLVSEIPIIDAVPALSLLLWRMYSVQIRVEKKDLKRYKEQRAAEELRERQRQAAAAELQARAMQEQQAANDEEYAEAANDEDYNPQGMEKAA
jgi:hypothetical protein